MHDGMTEQGACIQASEDADVIGETADADRLIVRTVRCPANELQPDSDLGALLVTRGVGELSCGEIDRALAAGAVCAQRLLAAGLIEAAALRLEGEMIVVGTRSIEPFEDPLPARSLAAEGAIHA